MLSLPLSLFFIHPWFSHALIVIVEIPKLGWLFFYSFKKKIVYNVIGTRAINWSCCVFHHQSVMSWARVCVYLVWVWILNSFSCSQTGKIFHCDNELFWQMSHQIQWIFCFVNLNVSDFQIFYAYMFHRALFFVHQQFKKKSLSFQSQLWLLFFVLSVLFCPTTTSPLNTEIIRLLNFLFWYE